MAASLPFHPRTGAWKDHPDAADEDDDRFDERADEIDERIHYRPVFDVALTALAGYQLYHAVTSGPDLLAALRSVILVATLLVYLPLTAAYLERPTPVPLPVAARKIIQVHADRPHYVLFQRGINALIVAGLHAFPGEWAWTNVALIMIAWLMLLRQLIRILIPVPQVQTIAA